jgi:lipoprotein-anchoring transpeptidase ErfK/SrfK
MKQSHGCIHVRDGEAERLFDWAGSNNVMVIVVMKDSEKRGRK